MSTKNEYLAHLDKAFRAPVYVRWSDLDELGMVNNAVFVTYLEEGRAHLFLQKLQWNWTETGVVVANININYRQPIRYENKPETYIFTKKLGNSSFVLHTIIAEISQEGDVILFAEADVTMVAYDLKKKKPTSVPEIAAKELTAFMLDF
jgi:acyl-CoA thioester hydrolase